MDMAIVYKEIEMYNAFHRLNQKYGKPFLDWYHENCDIISGDIPLIGQPQNEMERDIMDANIKINNPETFIYEEVCEFEEMVCKFLAQNISCSRVIHNEKDKMIMFKNRYSWFRHYYIVKGELSLL
jgi:hypothetical protein